VTLVAIILDQTNLCEQKFRGCTYKIENIWKYETVTYKIKRPILWIKSEMEYLVFLSPRLVSKLIIRN